MSDTIEVYSFERADGIEYDAFTTQDIGVAKRRAERLCLQLIANKYSWVDSELVENYTEQTVQL